MVASGTSITAAIVRQSLGRIPIRKRRGLSFKRASSNLPQTRPPGDGAAAQSARVKLCKFHTTVIGWKLWRHRAYTPWRSPGRRILSLDMSGVGTSAGGSPSGLRHKHAANHAADLAQIEWLCQERRTARLQEPALLGVEHVPGDEDDPLAEPWEASLDLVEELQAVHDGHLRVRLDAPEPLRPDRLRGLGCGGGVNPARSNRHRQGDLECCAPPRLALHGDGPRPPLHDSHTQPGPHTAPL